MLQVFTNNTSGVSVTDGSNINFTSKALQTGCVATANVGTDTVSLNKAGFYMVHFNASISASAAATEPLTVTMYEDGVAAEEASAVMYSVSATDIGSLAFSSIVRVKPSCCPYDIGKNLTFKVTGVDALVYNANVVVTKIA